MFRKGEKVSMRCDFCGNDNLSVIAGPDVYICVSCIGCSVDIVMTNLGEDDRNAMIRESDYLKSKKGVKGEDKKNNATA